MSQIVDLLSLGLALALLAVGEARAQGVTSPVFRGVMGMGNRQVALFEVPGMSGNWQGEAGQMIPGSNWKLMRVVLNPGATYLWVPGQKFQVVLKQGQTFTAAGRVERAPEVARPANVPPREYVAPAPEVVALRRQKQAAMAAQQRTPTAQPAAPAHPVDPSLVRTVDFSVQAPAIESLGGAPYDTVVMVTSPG